MGDPGKVGGGRGSPATRRSWAHYYLPHSELCSLSSATSTPILSPEPRSPPPEPAPGRPPGPRNPALPQGTPLPARPDRGAGSRSRLPKWPPEHLFAKTSKSVAPAETLQYYFVNVTRDHLAEHTPDPRNPALPPGTPLPARPDRCAGPRSRLPKWSQSTFFPQDGSRWV